MNIPQILIEDSFNPSADDRRAAFTAWLDVNGYGRDCENEVVGVDPIDRHCLITKDGAHFTVITARESYDFNWTPCPSNKFTYGLNRAGAPVYWYVLAN